MKSEEISTLSQQCIDNNIYVIVILGALQAIALENIKNFPGNPKIICLNFSKIKVHERANTIIFSLFSNNILTNLINYRRCFRELKKIKKVSKTFSVGIPHIHHSIANFLAFQLAPDNIDLLPDGLLNYYNAVPSKKQRRASLLKKIMCRLLGGKYQIHLGNLTAMETINYRNNYTFSEKGLYTKAGETIIIKLEAGPLKNSEAIFFLDQPLDDIDADIRKKIVAGVNEYVAPKSHIIYKPHRDQRQTTIKALRTQTLTSLPKEEIAEYALKKQGATEVVGIYSSALITLKILYPSVMCTSIGFNLLIKKRPELLSARKKMKSIGINIIDL